jgi:hypothetical protein
MAIIYILAALISPRLLLVILWIFTPHVTPNAFNLWVWPLLGLLFAPWLTLSLVWALNTEFGVLQIAAIVIATLLDFGSNQQGYEYRRRGHRGRRSRA